MSNMFCFSHVCPNRSLWLCAAAVLNFSSVHINSLCLLRPSTASRFWSSSFMPVSQHMRFKDGGKDQCKMPLKPRWAGFLLINIHSLSLFSKSNQHDSRYECLLTQQFGRVWDLSGCVTFLPHFLYVVTNNDLPQELFLPDWTLEITKST